MDAFWPQGASWSGQVISSPAGPSEGPFMTHLLPVGGVPRFYGARSPVPPQFPHFAGPWSVRYLATRLQALTHYVAPLIMVARGAGAAGPVLLACPQWDPHGLARMLRDVLYHYCLGGCNALLVCTRR